MLREFPPEAPSQEEHELGRGRCPAHPLLMPLKGVPRFTPTPGEHGSDRGNSDF